MSQGLKIRGEVCKELASLIQSIHQSHSQVVTILALSSLSPRCPYHLLWVLPRCVQTLDMLISNIPWTIIKQTGINPTYSDKLSQLVEDVDC